MRDELGQTSYARALWKRAEDRREILIGLVPEYVARTGSPVTVRQAFYLMTANHGVEKSENGYAQIQRLLAELRRSGAIAWHDIEDRSRRIDWVENAAEPTTDGMSQRIDDCHPGPIPTPKEHARKWADAVMKASMGTGTPWWTFRDCERPIILIEKDALQPQVEDAVKEWDVPVVSTRGFASLSQLYRLGGYLSKDDAPQPCVLWLHDWDMAGQKMEDQTHDLMDFAGEQLPVEHVALTSDQVREWGIQTRFEKEYAGKHAAELDAIPPEKLREVVRSAVETRIPKGLKDAVAKRRSEVEAAVRQRMDRLLYGPGRKLKEWHFDRNKDVTGAHPWRTGRMEAETARLDMRRQRRRGHERRRRQPRMFEITT